MKVFTGAVPFPPFQSISAAIKIGKGERPDRPTNRTLPDDVWGLMRKCWDQRPSARPEMGEVLRGLAPSLFRSLLPPFEASPEFQVALNQFYDGTEYKRCINQLRNAELEKFVNLLDTVRDLFNPF